MKYVLGRCAAGAAILFGLALHGVLSALIRVFDRGPVFYRARRLGLNGIPFDMLKYRSMKVGSRPVLGEGFKVVVESGDARVSTLGNWLRCGLDELPQLWNILRGEMSWVGPRPDEAWMLDHYGPSISERLMVRPGITGLAQILNSRENPTALGYAIDIWYRRHRSVSLDLWIMAMTPLYIAGFLSIGSRRLDVLRSSAEFQNLARACEQELSEALARTASAS
jgi:lipopolysaccharide/colanic/teichoic acid biosynthesis glycosyltransferase